MSVADLARGDGAGRRTWPEDRSAPRDAPTTAQAAKPSATTDRIARPGLSGLYDPRSVAVVGASADPAKWGHWLAAGALVGADRRRVHLVNRSGAEVLGHVCAPDLSALPEAPEVVVVATPAATAGSVVREAVDAGARYVVAVTAGLAEDEAALAAYARDRGARLLGPNCMGLVDHSSVLRLSWGTFPVGAVGLISQSGNLGLEIGSLLARAGQGFSRFVSVGNQRDITAVELLEDLIEHEPTKVIALYLEHIGDGRRLVAAMAAARSAGKPVLLLTSGASAAAQRAALSHTGALVSGTAAVQAACTAAGALRPASPGELVDAVSVLLAPAAPLGPRVAIVGDSGGQGALGADVFAAAGLLVPELDSATTAQLAALLPAHATSQNPVDLAGAGEADLTNYAAVADVLLRADDVNAVVLTGYFGDYATGTPSLQDDETAVAETLARASAKSGRPLVVHTMARETAAVAALRRGGVPVFTRIEQAAVALANAARWRTAVLAVGAEAITAVGAVSGAGTITGAGAVAGAGAIAETGAVTSARAVAGARAVTRAEAVVGTGVVTSAEAVAGAGTATGTGTVTRAQTIAGADAVTRAEAVAGTGMVTSPETVAGAEAITGTGATTSARTVARADAVTRVEAVAGTGAVTGTETVAGARTAIGTSAVTGARTVAGASAVTRVEALAGTGAVTGAGAARRLTTDGYLAARRLALSYGVRFPEARVVQSAGEAVDAAASLGYPVVLKATGLAHKTEAGGVALGLGDATTVCRAFAAMQRRVAAAAYTVEQMIAEPDAVELIVGVRNDPAFGPMILIGAGGVTAELDPDTALALAPVSDAQAADLIRTLRCARLLDGWRGAPAVDVSALAGLVAAVSRLAAEHPELADFELNPVLAGPSGALALDAHCVLAATEGAS